jgi:hypothetical protein
VVRRASTGRLEPPVSTFEAVRTITTWVRPGHDHGCAPTEVVPGVWNAHYHDIDTASKLAAVAPRVTLVVNTAPCQCAARAGSFGEGVAVLTVDLEDDPNERKTFDNGKLPAASACRQDGLPLTKRCAGNARQDFERVCDAIDATLASGGQVLVHCMASLSRSPCFLLAYLMRSRGLSLLDATVLLKSRWDATWPCDRLCTS